RVFLEHTEYQARQMLQRLTTDQGYDHTWQDALHTFYQELIPTAARNSIPRARKVLVVPHHILHYFPFAALVTEPGRRQLEKAGRVHPRFLAGEPFYLCPVPSLTWWDAQQTAPVAPIQQVHALGLVEVPGAPRLEGVDRELRYLRAAFGNRVRSVS